METKTPYGMERPDFISYEIKGETYYLPYNNFLIKMIDYGLGSKEYRGQSQGFSSISYLYDNFDNLSKCSDVLFFMASAYEYLACDKSQRDTLTELKDRLGDKVPPLAGLSETLRQKGKRIYKESRMYGMEHFISTFEEYKRPPKDAKVMCVCRI